MGKKANFLAAADQFFDSIPLSKTESDRERAIVENLASQDVFLTETNVQLASRIKIYVQMTMWKCYRMMDPASRWSRADMAQMIIDKQNKAISTYTTLEAQPVV